MGYGEEPLAELCRRLEKKGAWRDIPGVWSKLEGELIKNPIYPAQKTPEPFLDTIRINAELNPDGKSLCVFHPYPKIRLFDVCVERGLKPEISPNMVERIDSTMKLEEFPEKEIKFYLRNFFRLIRYEQLKKNIPTSFCYLSGREPRGFLLSL